jgi:hypothetical protein
MTNGKKLSRYGLAAIAFMVGGVLGSFMDRSIIVGVTFFVTFFAAWVVLVIDVFGASRIDYRR